MARKRNVRQEPTAGQRQTNRVDKSTLRNYFNEPSSFDRRLIPIFFFFFVVIPAVTVVFYLFNSSLSLPDISGSADQKQEDRFKVDLDYREILEEHSEVSENGSQRHYEYPVLGYITPWNSKGYDIAKMFTDKFTHLSPVWYDLKSQGSELVLEGRHNADRSWISELREENGDALVLPRVVLEAFPQELLKKRKLRNRAIELIVTECLEMEYDGIVLESWSRWAGYGVLHDPEMRNKALQFVKKLGNKLHSANSAWNSDQPLQLIYVIGPPHSEQLQVHDFTSNDLQTLSSAVDGFSLMTYDFSNPQNPGPNAPLKWIRLTLQLLLNQNADAQSLAPKIFLGMNFYGNDFSLSEDSGGGGAILGHDYLSLLDKYRPQLQWEEKSAEHFFLYVDDNGKRHAVFYPTLASISVRLEEAKAWGTGVSIWEIGQAASSFGSFAVEAGKQSKLGREEVEADGDGEQGKQSKLGREEVEADGDGEPRYLPSLKPLSILPNSRRRKIITHHLPHKISSSKPIHGGGGGGAQLTLLSSLLAAPLAKALTYEEALELSAGGADGLSGFDANGFVDTVIRFGSDNPIVVAGGVAAAVLAVPLILFQVLKSPKSFGIESARKAYEVLGEDPGAQLVDIRASSEVKKVGVPDVKGLGKKAVAIAYKGEDKAGFLKKLGLKFKEPATTTLFILDKFDGSSELVAELVSVNGFKAAYAIKDGVEGPKGWLNSGLPWTAPSKGLSFSNLSEAIGDLVGEGSDPLSVTLGVAAAAGLGALAFTEVETLLQLLGSAAIIQFASKKLLFAEDRKKTLKQVDEFLTTQVAPQELLGEIKQIGQALLPKTATGKALPAPTESSPEATASAATAEPVSEVAASAATTEPVSEVAASAATAEPVSQVAAASAATAEPVSQVAAASASTVEPVSQYPDLKPPTSPAPPQNTEAIAAEPAPQVDPVPELEASAAPAPQVDPVPEPEPAKHESAESIPKISRPLSPYASYPDFKPPTSPTPSPP
ncbi:Rhodanese-like domain-containing protein 4, chloroplastic [Linum perenne]